MAQFTELLTRNIERLSRGTKRAVNTFVPSAEARTSTSPFINIGKFVRVLVALAILTTYRLSAADAGMNPTTRNEALPPEHRPSESQQGIRAEGNPLLGDPNDISACEVARKNRH